MSANFPAFTELMAVYRVTMFCDGATELNSYDQENAFAHQDRMSEAAINDEESIPLVYFGRQLTS